MSAPALTVPAAPAPRHARLARYGWWQLRDYAISRGAPAFLIAAMFGALSIVPMLRGLDRSLKNTPPQMMARLMSQHGGTLAGVRQYMVHDMSNMFLRGFIGFIVGTAAVLAFSGLVSNDQRLGYYRFQFSKPVSPTRYYGQAFLVHLAGFVVVMTALAGLYGLYVTPLLGPTFLLVVAGVFMMYAGMTFLMTTLTRWDWLAVFLSVLVGELLWGRFGQSTNVAARMLYVLPPVHRTSAVYTALIGGTAIPWHTVAWIAGYGIICFASGLVVLRHRRLAIP